MLTCNFFLILTGTREEMTLQADQMTLDLEVEHAMNPTPPTPPQSQSPLLVQPQAMENAPELPPTQEAAE